MTGDAALIAIVLFGLLLLFALQVWAIARPEPRVDARPRCVHCGELAENRTRAIMSGWATDRWYTTWECPECWRELNRGRS